MNSFRNTVLTPYAQRLRRTMTREERRLWYEFIKPLGLPFRRQKIIGRYIVDFYCASAYRHPAVIPSAARNPNRCWAS